LRKTSFVIDGEAVVLGPDEISDFDALHGGARNAEVRLYAVALLTDDGVDMRDETLEIRKRWQTLNRRRAAHVASPTTLRENVHPKDTSS
jgi:ATP-dependent DNA ligase